MTGKLEVRSYTIDPRELTLLTKNARKMPQRQFKQLCANLERDGTLTSAPLIHRDAAGKLVVLSGNHRTKASIAVGFTSIPVLEVVGDDLDAERLLAIQLSHNAINGEDDQNILAELYESLGVMGKLYSGLTDADFGGVDALDLAKLSIGAPAYEMVQLLFLPEDREVFIEAMEKLGKGAAKAVRYVAMLDGFANFENALVAVQDTLKIHNQALAVQAMAELALERLDQLGTGNADGTEESSSSETEAATSTEPTDQEAGGGRPARKRRNPSDRRAKAEGEPVDGL